MWGGGHGHSFALSLCRHFFGYCECRKSGTPWVDLEWDFNPWNLAEGKMGNTCQEGYLE